MSLQSISVVSVLNNITQDDIRYITENLSENTMRKLVKSFNQKLSSNKTKLVQSGEPDGDFGYANMKILNKMLKEFGMINDIPRNHPALVKVVERFRGSTKLFTTSWPKVIYMYIPPGCTYDTSTRDEYNFEDISIRNGELPEVPEIDIDKFTKHIESIGLKYRLDEEPEENTYD